jgi:hypothetical protein
MCAAVHARGVSVHYLDELGHRVVPPFLRTVYESAACARRTRRAPVPDERLNDAGADIPTDWRGCVHRVLLLAT